MSKPAQDGITVRLAAPGDGAAFIAAFVAINAETEFLGVPEELPPWADTADVHLAAAAASESEVILIAIDGGAIVGYLGAFVPLLQSCRGSIYISSLGLRATHRGRGIGGRLLDAMEAWARARAAWRLELRVVVENARALALYRKHGYAIEGRLAAAFLVDGVARDNYFMAKRLADPVGPPAAPIDAQLGGAPWPPGVVLRPLAAGDGAALQRFEYALLNGPPIFLNAAEEIAPDVAAFDRQVAEALDNPRCHVVLATDAAGRVIGHAGSWHEPWARVAHDAYCQVTVLRPWWGHGIGRALAQSLASWIATQPLTRLNTAVQGHNRRGLRFAEAQGFTVEATARGFARIAGTEVDRVRLARLLVSAAPP